MGPGYFFSLLQSSGVSAATDFGTHPRLRKTIRRGRTRIYGCWYSVRGVKPNVYQYPRSYMVRCRHLQRLDLLFSPRAGDIAALLSFGAKVWMFRRWGHFRPCNGDASGCYWPRKEIAFENIDFAVVWTGEAAKLPPASRIGTCCRWSCENMAAIAGRRNMSLRLSKTDRRKRKERTSSWTERTPHAYGLTCTCLSQPRSLPASTQNRPLGDDKRLRYSRR